MSNRVSTGAAKRSGLDHKDSSGRLNNGNENIQQEFQLQEAPAQQNEDAPPTSNQFLGSSSFYCGITIEDDEERIPNFDDSGKTPCKDKYSHVRNDAKYFKGIVEFPTYPNGVMLVSRSEHINCEGYICGGIQIRYVLDVSGKIHSSLGERYRSDHRTAYLPDNEKGGKVLELLKEAWRRKLTFRFAPSSSESFEMAWNVRHKASDEGSSEGYPDPNYLREVAEDLNEMGVTFDEGQRHKLRSRTIKV